MVPRVALATSLAVLVLTAVAPARAQVTLTTGQACYQTGEEVAVTIHNGSDQQILVEDGLVVRTQEGTLVWEPVCTNDGIVVLEPGESFTIETTWDQTDRGNWTTSGCAWVGAEQVPDGCYRAVKGYQGSPGGVVSADFGIGECPCPADVAPSTLEGPTVVYADPLGAFSYEALFTAGGGGVGLSFATAYGGDNTDFVEWVADGECLEPYDEGHQTTESLSGSLINPGQPGSVTLQYRLCSGEDLILETTVLPSPAGVPTVSQWGLMLMAVGLLAAGSIVFRRLF